MRAPMTAFSHCLAAAYRTEPPPADATARCGDLLLAEQDRLRRLVHRLLGWPATAADVDDVVQDVLLLAWRHHGAFRGDAALSTWLVRIAVRRTRRHQRWRHVRDRVRSWLAPDEVATTNPCAVERCEAALALRVAMARLPATDREVLVLRYLEDRSIAECADALSCSRTAVDQRLSRARARLRALLPAGGGA